MGRRTVPAGERTGVRPGGPAGPGGAVRAAAAGVADVRAIAPRGADPTGRRAAARAADHGSAAPATAHGSSRRRAVLGLAATILAVAGLLAPSATSSVRAAGDGLDLTTASTYSVVPARHLVHVLIAITAVNNKPNVVSGGLITKYFYDGARIAIQTEAQSIQATTGGARLTATTTPEDGYRILEVRFRSSLFFHQITRVDVAFDLPGGAPRSASRIRVGSAFATFVAWAFGDRGSVRVVVPPGFSAETSGSAATRTTSGGSTVFSATGIDGVDTWYLVVNADRQSALTSERLDLPDGEHVVIRAWPEDAAWKRQVGQLLARGLPDLVADIGLAWPVTGDLSIFEVHTPLLEGYSGLFLEGQDKIEISEDLDDQTILHEASHAWFNSDLFVGRWIDEGFADTYAARTVDALGLGSPAPANVSSTERAAVPLDAWTFPGRITDAQTEARERFGYDASWTVVRALVADVGPEAMRQVLAAAEEHRIAYVGAGTPETVSGPNDWRRLIDLLDETGRARTTDDLFREWVLTEPEISALADRATARTAYGALVAAAGDWRQPLFVRSAMSDWDFALAERRIADAQALLAQRDAIATRAGELGVVPPPDLRTAYESAVSDLSAAAAVASRERADLDALGAAADAVAAPRAPLVALGLLGATPDADLADARAAFNAGVADAGARALAVTALIESAAEVGRGRLIAAVAVALVVLVLLVLTAVLLFRRRRRHGPASTAIAVASATDAGAVAAPGFAAATEPAPSDARPIGSVTEPGPTATAAPPGLAPEPPYVTLADQSARPPDADPLPPGSTAAEGIGAVAEDATTGSPDPVGPDGPPPADTGDAS